MENAAGPPAHRAGAGPTGVATVELEVSGMHCASCSALIEEVLAEEPAVERASVDLGTGRGTVTFDPSAMTVDDVVAAVASAGYTATPLSTVPGDPAP